MICVPIQAVSLREFKQKMAVVPKDVDLIEIWVDHLPTSIPAKEILSATKRKVVIVNKPKREKGKWNGTEDTRVKRLIEFADAKADYIDIGIDTKPSLIKSLAARVSRNKGTKLIISYHNFHATPPATTLDTIVKKAWSYRPAIVKIAVYAKSNTDNFILFDLLKAHRTKSKTSRPFIAIAMGPLGKITRVAGLAMGNHINYISLDERNSSAPGQLTYKQYKSIKQIIEIT